MYFVHYYDYGSIAVRVGITKIKEMNDLNTKVELERIKNTMEMVVDTFSELESAYDFIAALAPHCDFYCLKDAKGVHLRESDLCRQRRELSIEFELCVKMNHAKLFPLFSGYDHRCLN